MALLKQTHHSLKINFKDETARVPHSDVWKDEKEEEILAMLFKLRKKLYGKNDKYSRVEMNDTNFNYHFYELWV